MRREVARALRSIFRADTRAEAAQRLEEAVSRYSEAAPGLATWIEEAIPEGLTVLDLPEPHRRRLRTTNALERLNAEIKRRTRVARLFPNENSLLRLVSAVLVEFDEEWGTAKTYLNLKTE